MGKDLQLFEELAGGAGDVDAARNAALTILDALDDAGGFGALRAIRALVGIHDLLTVASLGNLCHNSCSPWYECFGSRAGYPMLPEVICRASKTSGTSQDCPGSASVEIEGEELRLWLL